jgi:hypothetical protein
MAQLGHSSTRAAMIYQYATRDRDEAIAKALDGRCTRCDPIPPTRPAKASEKSVCGPFVARRTPAVARDDHDPAGDRSAELGLLGWSGRRESDSHDQLGSLRLPGS